MQRRTHHLPHHLDQAVTRLAQQRNTSPASIVREALTAYLVIEGVEQQMNRTLDAIHQEQHACLLMMKELLARFTSNSPSVEVTPHSDRVRARFNQIINKEEQHGSRNR